MRFAGTSSDSDKLGGIAAANFLRSNANDTTSGTLGIVNDTGLTVGADNDIKFSVDGTGAIIQNQVSDTDITFKVNDGGSTTTVMTIDGSESRVGIGTNSPGNKLHVKAGASGASSFDSRYNLILEDNGENYIAVYSPTNNFGGLRFLDSSSAIKGYIDYYHGTQGDKFQIYAQKEVEFSFPSVGEQVTFQSNGSTDPIKVGIGTTTPSSTLDVEVNGDKRIVLNQTGAGHNSGLQLQYAGTRTWDIYNSGTPATPLYFYSQVAGASTMTLTTTGNVGIGNTAPSAFLHVSKDNDNTGNQFAVADTEGVSPAVRTYTYNGDPAALILNHYYAVGGSSNEYMRYADFVANVGSGAGTTMLSLIHI